MEAPSCAACSTREWVAIVGEEATRLLAASGGAVSPFTLVERHRNAPADRQPEAPSTPGFRLDLDGDTAVVRFGVAPTDIGDLNVEVEFAWAERMCALRSGPELDALSRAGRAQGQFHATGDARRAPFALADLHDALVARTAR